LDQYGNSFIRRLLDAGMSIETVVWIIMPTAAAGTANQGQQVSSPKNIYWLKSIQLLDLYLSEKYKKHWPEICRLAQQDDDASKKTLRKYVMEGDRISTQSFGLFRRVAEATVVKEAGATYNLKPNDEIFVNLVIPLYCLPTQLILGWSKYRSRCIPWSVGS
jgi:hypothetical protein